MSYITENFDGVTAPARPSGWTGSPSLPVTTTTKKHSGANSLLLTGAGDYCYAWNPTTDAGEGNVVARAWYSPGATAGSLHYFFVYARATLLPSGSTIDNGFSFYGSMAGGSFCGFESITGAIRTTVLELGIAPVYSASDWYEITFDVVDAADGTYQLLAGYVKRESDGFYLQPSGSWVNTGVRTPVATAVAAKYNAGWASGSYAIYGAYLGGGELMYVDDVTYADAEVWTAGPRPANPPAAGAEVELVPAATVVSDVGIAGHDVTKINTTNLSDGWVASARSGGWCRLDAGVGVAVTPTAILFTPALYEDVSHFGVEQGMMGAFIEGANATSGPWTQLGRLAMCGYPEPRNIVTQRLDSTTPGGTYRYIRIRAEKDWANVGQFGVLCTNSGGVSWRPPPPELSTAGGSYAAGATVTGVCRASGSSIYTTAGTWASPPANPTNSDTLYTAPVTIPQNAPAETVIKFVGYHASGTNPYSRVVTGYYVCPLKIVPDTGLSGNDYIGNGVTTANWPMNRRDTRGVLLEINAGGVVYDPTDSLHHLVGQNFNTGNTGVGVKRGFRHYTSPNLVNWDYAGQCILPVWPLSSAVDAQVSAYQTRLHYLVNPSPLSASNRLAGWVHAGDNTAGKAVVCTAANWPTATSDATFTWGAVQSPEGNTQAVGDSNVFYDSTDDDGTGHSRGKAYLLCTQSTTVFKGWLLDPATDWTTFTGTAVFSAPIPGEGPCMFGPVGGYRFVVHSAGVPYGGGNSTLDYFSATTVAGLSGATNHHIWSTNPAFPVSPTVAYNAQTTCVFAVGGLSAPAFVMLCDLMGTDASPVNPYDFRCAWWPINSLTAFPSPGTLAVDSPAAWDLSDLPPVLSIGSASVLLGAVSLASAAVAKAVASLSVTLGAATFTSAGVGIVSGSVSVSLGAAVSVSAGTSTISGSLSAALGTLTMVSAGDGTSPADGSFSVVLDAATVAASGAVTVSGSLGKTLGAVVLVSHGTTGGVTPGGTVTGVLTLAPIITGRLELSVDD